MHVAMTAATVPYWDITHPAMGKRIAVVQLRDSFKTWMHKLAISTLTVLNACL